MPIQTIPASIIVSAPIFPVVMGSLKKIFDQNMVQMYPAETMGYRTDNSPCFNPITNGTLDPTYKATPVASCQLKI